jgi:acetyl esterase/lipase
MNIGRRSLLGLAATGVATAALGQTPPPISGKTLPSGLPQPSETIDLWPNGAPGMPASALVETVNERSTDAQLTDRAVFGISRPRMAVFRPSRPNGAAVMITPGGGYRWVVVDKEGYELGRWLSARGFTVFVLFYRLPGEGWAAGPDVALSDAQRAMRLIRYRASDYGVDPERVAAMGFSAGGHLCCDLTARFAKQSYLPTDQADTLSARPFVSAPIYPVVSMSTPFAHNGSREKLLGPNPSLEAEKLHSPNMQISDNAPPVFLVHSEDDDVVPVENSLLFREALRAKNIPVETHLFTHGGHGFGLRKAIGKPAEVWPQLFLDWARTMGLGG